MFYKKKGNLNSNNDDDMGLVSKGNRWPMTIHKIHKTIVFYTRLGFSVLDFIFVFESIRLIKNSCRESISVIIAEGTLTNIIETLVSLLL